MKRKKREEEQKFEIYIKIRCSNKKKLFATLVLMPSNYNAREIVLNFVELLKSNFKITEELLIIKKRLTKNLKKLNEYDERG